MFMWTRYLIIDLVSKVDRFELQKSVTFFWLRCQVLICAKADRFLQQKSVNRYVDTPFFFNLRGVGSCGVVFAKVGTVGVAFRKEGSRGAS